jgi:hypothetical protein
MNAIVLLVMSLLVIGGTCYLIARSVRTRLVRAGNRYPITWFIVSFFFSFALMLGAIYLILLNLPWGR